MLRRQIQKDKDKTQKHDVSNQKKRQIHTSILHMENCKAVCGDL